MENVLLDRSSESFEFNPRMAMGNCRRRGPGGMPVTPYNCSFPMYQPQYHQVHRGGAWSSAPALPYARPPPAIYSSPSLPLLPSNQPPLLPLPPTATKYATFPNFLPSVPPPPPPQRAAGVRGAAVANATAPAAEQTGPAPRQRDRRRRPAKPAPPTATEKKKKPLQRAEPLPPASVLNEMLDDLEQEVARNFVQDLLHALAPPPSSLPLPRFSLVMNASQVAAAPSCNAEAAAADGIRGLLRL